MELSGLNAVTVLSMGRRELPAEHGDAIRFRHDDTSWSHNTNPLGSTTRANFTPNFVLKCVMTLPSESVVSAGSSRSSSAIGFGTAIHLLMGAAPVRANRTRRQTATQ